MAKTSVPSSSASGKSGAPTRIRVTPLIRVFERLTDWRKAQGKVYSLASLLVFVLTGLLCGQRGPTAIAEWGAELPFEIRAAIGLPLGRRPSVMMLCRLLWHLDPDELEAALRLWMAEINAQFARAGDSRRMALDGKTQRGAAKRGAQSAHLLAAVSHQFKIVLGQVPVDSKTNEITVVSELLKLLVVEGYLITMDALLTQREIAQEIIARKADYLMVVKDNQPQLAEDIRICFDSEPLPGEVRGTACTVNKDHGRLEVREIVTSAALKDFLSDWPGLEQVMQITSTVTKQSTGETTMEKVYAITSLPPERGSPEVLLEARRGHWIIENSVHWTRDATLGEDACAVHKGRSSQTLAALRNVVLALVRLNGCECVAKAIRRYAARPIRAVHTIRATGAL
jgi:predicted transposase YbfD/YdcC